MSAPAPQVADSGKYNPHTGLVDPSNEKLKQLLGSETGSLKYQTGRGGCPFLAMQTGMQYMDDDNSLKAGARGPSLLEDQVHREKMSVALCLAHAAEHESCGLRRRLLQ
jgi:hypothetical protein